MRKQKMGHSQANNSETAKDGAKVTAGVSSSMTSFFMQKLVIVRLLVFPK